MTCVMKLFINSQTSMDMVFHPTLYWGCDYLSMLGLSQPMFVKGPQVISGPDLDEMCWAKFQGTSQNYIDYHL